MAITADELYAGETTAEQTRPAGLALMHMWVAFITFLLAAALGVYQLLVRAEIWPALSSGELYYASVTAHGTIMGYVLTTFFIAGFGYYVASTSLKQRVWSVSLAWLGFALMLVGTVLAAYVMFTGQASVLYTFYPPNIGHWGYYLGATLIVVGSWFWVLNMIMMYARFKRENGDKPVPLAMYAYTANAILWFLTSLGVALEILFQLLPLSLGLVDTVDVGLARTLFSWTLHAIVYFWLIPAYIAFYVFLPKAAGGRLISDEMGRVAFIMLLVFSLPIGFHHLYMDPQHAAGWKLLHAFGTFMVAVPTLITGFTIIATMEIAGRLRGGKGLFGWIAKIPWGNPMVLATGLSLLMLTYGGFGGMINASYALNIAIHNTQWVTAHFHAIFGGTTVIMYFAIAYYLWPSMTGRALISEGAARLQLWLWTIGTIVLTAPWHILGLLGQPRRVAFTPFDPEITDRWTFYEHGMILGGLIMLISAGMFVWILARSHFGQPVQNREVAYAEAVHPPLKLPKLMNTYGLWVAIIVFYMILSYGYPILQFLLPPSLGGLEGFNPGPWP